MPDLVGVPIVSAQAMLSRVGIRFGEPKFVDTVLPGIAPIGQRPALPAGMQAGGAGAAPAPVEGGAPPPMRPTAAPGAVIAQSPPPGFRVEVGSTVTLTVAK
jgi:beta-lactam-binding protein with PASTA domain